LTKSYIRRSTHKKGMAFEALLEKPAARAAKQPPVENLFFVTRETTVESNRRALELLAQVAGQFPMDSVIKKEIASLHAQARKDPTILTKMVSTIGVEQIA